MNKYFLYILFYLIPTIIEAQVVNDAKLWSSITVNKKIEDLEISFNQEFRLDENFSHVDKFFTELGAEYEFIKSLSGSFNYRFARENDYEDYGYELNHRFDFGIKFKHKIEDWRFSNRIKYQTKTATPYENNPAYIRNKLMISYKTDKLSPYVSYEFFYQFNDERVINRTRISLGSKFDISDKSSLKCFYTFENRFNTRNLQHNHIYGIGYSIDL